MSLPTKIQKFFDEKQRAQDNLAKAENALNAVLGEFLGQTYMIEGKPYSVMKGKSGHPHLRCILSARAERALKGITDPARS